MPRTSLVPPGGPSDTIWPGEPWPLGATWDGNGVNFAIYSENATRIDVCLFAEPNGGPIPSANPPTNKAGIMDLHANRIGDYTMGLCA